MALSWDEFESLVLQWVFEHAGEDTGLLLRHDEAPFDEIPTLTKPQVAEAIERLTEHGLLVARGSTETHWVSGMVRGSADRRRAALARRVATR